MSWINIKLADNGICQVGFKLVLRACVSRVIGTLLQKYTYSGSQNSLTCINYHTTCNSLRLPSQLYSLQLVRLSQLTHCIVCSGWVEPLYFDVAAVELRTRINPRPHFGMVAMESMVHRWFFLRRPHTRAHPQTHARNPHRHKCLAAAVVVSLIYLGFGW